MRVLRSLATTCLLALALTGAAVSVPTTAAARPPAKVMLEGLSSPKGIDMGSGGGIIVAQGAFGAPGPVLFVPPLRGHGGPVPVTDPASLTDVAVSPFDGTGFGIGPDPATGDVWLYHQLSDGSIVSVLNITAYQAIDIDPVDQDEPPDPGESNPYGLAVMRNGDALVADAAGNDVLRVTPDGDATTVARLDVESISTDHLPPEMGLPPFIDAEAVPTTVAIGPDGAIYVGELKGFPFRPGSSHIWRIDASADGAWCSVNTPDPQCTVHDAGFTAIQDIAFEHDGGAGAADVAPLYVYELAAGGVLEFEEGFETGEFPPAVLLSVEGGERTEIVPGQLSQPGGVTVSPNGAVYVTDGMFGNGRLVRALE